MKTLSSLTLLGLAITITLSGCASTKPVTDTTPIPDVSAKSSKSDDESPFKPFAEVITEAAVSDSGLFNVYQVDDDLFFEIPDDLIGREMLLVSRIAQTPADLSPFLNGGSKVGEQVVRWERRKNDILLRRVSHQNVADDSLAVSIAVAVNNFEPILGSFSIEALSEDSSGVLIQINELFEKDIPALSGLSSGQRTRFKVRRLDANRSFIDETKSFPQNVNVRHTMTYEAGAPPSNTDTGTISMQMYQSMILLSETPMTPRLTDPRVGFFSVRQIDFGLEDQKAAEISYIRRWDLEPSDKDAYMRGELVTPVKPIVYYLDPGTPEKWRSYFCMGVEDWNRSFEAAGFKDAVECRMPPTNEEDPDFDPEDVRYSTVRYVANTTRNATGPSVSDPRSGEIIESDIIWYHNHIRSYRNRLMIETGAANPGARSLMLDDDLIGETMRQVIAHEIGHALGLPHNMIASSSFPVDSLRSPTFTSEYGVAPTIMDYTRQNYIAQPGDGVTRFVRKIGPYDDYVIEWGYRWFPDVDEPTDESSQLNALVMEHAGDPMYRFSTGSGSYNPDAQTEDMGNDPVQASTYAVANLKRVVPNLVDWTSTDGKGYGDLNEIYGELLGMWRRYMYHVVTVVGGVYVTPKTSEQEGSIYKVVPREKQEIALQFLIDNVFETPTWLVNNDLLRRIEHAGTVDRLRSRQVSVLNNLLSPQRLQRMIEATTVDGETGYPLIDFMSDLKAGVWNELRISRPVVDTYRRNLQRGYLERLEYLLTEEPDPRFAAFFGAVDVSQSDIRAVVRGQLKELRAESLNASRRTRDSVTRYHLLDLVDRIDTVLDVD